MLGPTDAGGGPDSAEVLSKPRVLVELLAMPFPAEDRFPPKAASCPEPFPTKGLFPLEGASYRKTVLCFEGCFRARAFSCARPFPTRGLFLPQLVSYPGPSTRDGQSSIFLQLTCLETRDDMCCNLWSSPETSRSALSVSVCASYPPMVYALAWRYIELMQTQNVVQNAKGPLCR